mgnify:CR=1 FL=1
MFQRLVTTTSLCLLTAACGGGDPEPGHGDTSAAAESATFRAPVPLSAAVVPADAALPGEVLIKLRRASDVAGVMTQHRLSLIGRFGARPMYRMRLIGSTDVNAKVLALRAYWEMARMKSVAPAS